MEYPATTDEELLRRQIWEAKKSVARGMRDTLPFRKANFLSRVLLSPVNRSERYIEQHVQSNIYTRVWLTRQCTAKLTESPIRMLSDVVTIDRVIRKDQSEQYATDAKVLATLYETREVDGLESPSALLGAPQQQVLNTLTNYGDFLIKIGQQNIQEQLRRATSPHEV